MERAWLELSDLEGVTIQLLKQWFSTQMTVYRKLNCTNFGQGKEEITMIQEWVVCNLFFKQHIQEIEYSKKQSLVCDSVFRDTVTATPVMSFHLFNSHGF